MESRPDMNLPGLRIGWVFLGGLFLGLGCLGGNWTWALALFPICLTLAWMTRKTDDHAVQIAEERNSTEKDPAIFLKSEQEGPGRVKQGLDMLKSYREERRNALQLLEESIDLNLIDALTLLKRALGESVLSLGVFLPGRQEGIYLRVWITDSDAVVPGARLGNNQGLVGQLMKDGGRRVLEGDIITGSTNLHYYSRDVGIRSLAAVPIIVHGGRRGAVFADSLKAAAFDNITIALLENAANVAGHLVYHAYTSFENGNQRDQLTALTNYQSKFLENMSEEGILANVQDYMEQSLEGDRFMIAASRGIGGEEAVVLLCKGTDAEHFQKKAFKSGEKTLLSLVLRKGQVLQRSLVSSEYIPRLSGDEKRNDGFRSILAVPVPTDQGTDFVLSVESAKLSGYSDHHKQMLMAIAREAGFALSRARLYQEKEQLASRDGLTGIHNHRAFQDLFKNEILRAQRYGYHLAILMIDIDFFKKVNDTYGHPVGDVVLKEVSLIISQNIREGSDVLARYGGEEFVCMLVDTDPIRAGETAERIRESVARKSFDVGVGHSFAVTMSIGGALFPADSKHGKELLEKADKALYKAKETGRNRLIFYNN